MIFFSIKDNLIKVKKNCENSHSVWNLSLGKSFESKTTLSTFLPVLHEGKFKGLLNLFIYLGFLCHFQHCSGHAMMGSVVGRGNHFLLQNVLK